MRRPLALLFIILISTSCLAQIKWNSRYQSYIDQYRNLAIAEMLKYDIPASITLAQGLLESGAGMSELAVKGNNHFGIKCHGWQGATTYHDDDASQECFRAYSNVYESYEDHSSFLSSQPRYKCLFSLGRTNYKAWAKGLKRCGYATNPAYAQRLINIIELYKLYEYDHAKSYDKFMAKHPSTDKPSTPGGQLHRIYIYNKNYYLKASRGDTFRSLAKEVGISYRKLAKYNERPKDAVLQEGDIVYLKKKQKRAEKQYKKRPHTVKAGESMYSIAQYYGIRAESLYKMNHLRDDYSPRVGDKLRVR